MLKKNTRKRLLAGALATVMMLTMCPSWALADDEDIATLPANEEIAVPVVDSTPAADPTETPAVPTPSEPEAKPAEGQDTAPAPSEGEANGDTDSAETGNSTNPTISEGSENNSQNNNAANSTPDVNNQPQDAANEANSFIDGLDLTMEASMTKKRDAEMWITNRHAADKKGKYTFTIRSDIEKIDTEDGVSVASLVEETREAYADDNKYNTVFWQARVHRAFHHQGTGSNDDKTQLGTEITRIRYKDGKFEYRAKGSDEWTKFALTDQLVFYYLIRTEYSQMVQIDVSDWTVDKEDTDYKDRRSVTYQVIVDGGVHNGKVLASRKFWYNKAFTVSSVRVREIGNDPNYSIDRVALDPLALGTVTDENGEYRFSLDLRETERNATVNIYVTPNVDPHKLTYVWNGGKITSAKGTYTDAGWVWPDETITTPTVEQAGFDFGGWYTDAGFKNKWEGKTMPNENLTLHAKWTANTPTPEPEPEPKLTEARYFVLLPTRDTPKSGKSQGEEHYLPSSKSDGGVAGKNNLSGYTGAITAAGKAAADDTYTPDDATNGIYNVNGFGDDYLRVPTDLGFFTKTNWSEDGTTYIKEGSNTSNPFSVLGDNFNVNNISIVWYTIKYQGEDNSYHVDGYVTGVPVTVTYHSNDSAISGAPETTSVVEATSGDHHIVLGNTFTAPNGYEFGGWYTDAACTKGNEVAVGFDKLLMNSWNLYAKWVPKKFDVSYFVDNEQYGETEEYTVGTDVTVRTAHPEKEGYTFTGWTSTDSAFDIRGFKMPAHAVVIEGKFEKNPAKQYTYTVNKHFYNEKGVEVNVVKGEATPAAENTAVSDLYKADAKNQTVDGKTYVYVSGLTTVTDNLEKLTKDVTIDLYYYLNVEGGNDIPDAWEYRLTFKVVNGSWNDGGNADIVTYVQCKDKKTGEAFEAEDVVVPVTRIPAVGDKPNSGYHAGAWDTSPYDNYKVQKDTVFTYTYAKNSSGGSSGGHHRRPTVTIPDDVPTGLNGDDHYAYIVGYPDKTVRPQNGITRAEVATIFFRLLTDETRDANSTKSNSYSDVAAGAWYNHAVSTLSAMGIVKGSNGKFNPNAPITRAEFAAIAARFDDKANTTTADFSDIASHWAKNEISAASNNGWITGYPDGTFRPDNKITRAEAMTLVNRVLKRLPETEEDLHDDMIKWSDNSDVSQWFYLDVQEATNSHYYQTKENQFEKWTKLRETRDWTELEK